tara:strand:+ start:216 stop:389 length:174 start_codon:yes stop_codon:yes gene_type:complete
MTKQQLHELRERVQEDLLTYFDGVLINMEAIAVHEQAMDGMCEIIVNNFNKYEGQTL